MSSSAAPSVAPPPTPALTRAASARARFRRHLHERRFWAVQALVLVATAIHLSFDWWEAVRGHQPSDLFTVVMYAVFFVPVIYASLNFGREGAIPTAVWTAVLASPSIIFFHHGLERLAEAGQHLTIIALAVVIASRVDREVAARREAEIQSQARKLSEALYRGLFEGAGEAILVFDAGGIVQEANAAAADLFDRPVQVLRGSRIRDLLGEDNAATLFRSGSGGDIVVDDLLLSVGARETWISPVCGIIRDGTGARVTQALLRDVTARRAQQRGLETFTQRIVQAQEEERRRIARELHDGSLQSLVLLCRRLDALEDAADHAPSVGLSGQLSEARQTAEAVADELRRFSRDLRPSVLDDLGLVSAIRWLLSDLERRTDVAARLLINGTERRLSPDAELGLFRIAQEALHNVERHAAASGVVVTLDYQTDELLLRVEDDGIGISVENPIPASGLSGKLGLLGMQERARLIGGRLRVTSEPGHGTAVQVSLRTND